MNVLILTKRTEHDYETSRLIQKFEEENITAQVCTFSLFDIVINNGIYYNNQPLELPDLVLVRLGAGISRSELSVVRYFELAGVPCINSSASINLVQDKFQTSEILSHHGIAVPTTMMAKFPIKNNLVDVNIGFPCILKVVVGSYGDGVYLCQTQQEYVRVIELVNALHNEKTLITQEYLGDRPGEDLRVFVVGDKVIGAMLRTAPQGDFRANITHGGTGQAYQLTPEICDIALQTTRALGLTISGVDLLFDTRGFRVCEANSNPGFKGFDSYCDTDIAAEIVQYVKSLLQK
jgi:gamma-F420-2:alpha-L-glutamate ligase